MVKLYQDFLELQSKKNFQKVILMRIEKLAQMEHWDGLIEFEDLEIFFIFSKKGNFIELYKDGDFVLSTKKQYLSDF